MSQHTFPSRGVLAIAIWLILTGLLPLLNINFPARDRLLALLAVVAGILLLLETDRAKPLKNLGPVALSLWLIISGVLPLLNLTFAWAEMLLAALAVAAGVLLLLKRDL